MKRALQQVTQLVAVLVFASLPASVLAPQAFGSSHSPIEAALRQVASPPASLLAEPRLLRRGGLTVPFRAPEAGTVVVVWHSPSASGGTLTLARGSARFKTAASRAVQITIPNYSESWFVESGNHKVNVTASFIPQRGQKITVRQVIHIPRLPRWVALPPIPCEGGQLRPESNPKYPVEAEFCIHISGPNSNVLVDTLYEYRLEVMTSETYEREDAVWWYAIPNGHNTVPSTPVPAHFDALVPIVATFTARFACVPRNGVPGTVGVGAHAADPAHKNTMWWLGPTTAFLHVTFAPGQRQCTAGEEGLNLGGQN